MDMSDPVNPGPALRNMFRLTPPSAPFVLMSRASHGKKLEYLKSGAQGSKQWLFHDTKRMGQNAVGACLQQLAEMAGISEWRKKTNHTLRQHTITELANNPNVNRVETAKVARHKCTKTQDTYTRPTEQSEVQRNLALCGGAAARKTPHAQYSVPVNMLQPSPSPIPFYPSGVSPAFASHAGRTPNYPHQQVLTGLVNPPPVDPVELAKVARHSSSKTQDSYNLQPANGTTKGSTNGTTMQSTDGTTSLGTVDTVATFPGPRAMI